MTIWQLVIWQVVTDFLKVTIPIMVASILLIAIVFIPMAYICSESRQQQEQTYRAWCKLANREDISIEEWVLLRNNHLLPGMQVRRQLEK